MRRFQEAGIGRRPHFTPIHLQPFYRAEFGLKEGDFPVTELAGRTSIAIPFHNRLTAEKIDHAADVLERGLALEEVQKALAQSSRSPRGWGFLAELLPTRQTRTGRPGDAAWAHQHRIDTCLSILLSRSRGGLRPGGGSA